MAQAVYALEAERRWVVSGTPIVSFLLRQIARGLTICLCRSTRPET